jgi:4-hydroxybenzoate polyprenyltransferase
LLASGLYLINDIVDAKSDRAHPEKRTRPIASGALSTRLAWFVAFLLVVGGFTTAAFLLGPAFLIFAVVYALVTLAYSLSLKRVIVLDGMLIAGGFVVRVVGGAVAIGVAASHWLIVCAFLLALFLAFTKRRQELLMLSDQAALHRHVLGQYTVEFLDRANNILLAATLVCYALYTVAPETIQHFGTEKLLYGTTFVLYGLLRYLALQQNQENGGNPTKMLLKDKPLLLAVLGWAIFNALVIYRKHLMLF